jgi:curved DNA-binding protein CbpA
LGTSRDADKAEIKKAFKRAALVSHPDKGGTDEDFQAVNLAYQILGDEKKRATYDRVSKVQNIINFQNV